MLLRAGLGVAAVGAAGIVPGCEAAAAAAKRDGGQGDPALALLAAQDLATAQLEATVEVPSLGFGWKSDPLATSSAAFGVIGEEKNGRYFTP